MANIQLNHEGVDQAVSDMTQAANQMKNAVEDLINSLQPLAQSFQGAAAGVFSEISKNRMTIYNDLTTTFSAGTGALDTMHQNLTEGDRRGASILGG